jgi:hypothetical protein
MPASNEQLAIRFIEILWDSAKRNGNGLPMSQMCAYRGHKGWGSPRRRRGTRRYPARRLSDGIPEKARQCPGPR